MKFKPPITIVDRSIQERVKRLLDNASDIVWNRKTQSFKDDFERKLDRLFDITKCQHTIFLCSNENSKCPNPNDCKTKAHIPECNCLSSSKLPGIDLHWMYCQRNKTGEISTLQMTSNDKKETKRQKLALNRKLNAEKAAMKKKEKEKIMEQELKEREVCKGTIFFRDIYYIFDICYL